MKRIYGILAAAAAALLAAQCALAAAPGRVSYQGTLRKDGRLYSGTAAMEFRLVNADASETYWSSGSTDVVVSTGLFRYPLGTPNEAQFALVNWKDITPYVQMRVDGAWLPAEPLYSSVYALHAATAESSTGTFTVNEGNLRLAAGAAGTRGVAFPDGTVQYYAPGWAVAPTLTYTSFAGSAALGLATPQARLDVQSAPGDQYAQIWRDSSGAEVASMTVAGRLFADGSAIRQLPGGADSLGTHVATMTLLMGGNPIANAGAVTASGALTTYSSATVASPLGLGSARVELRPGVALSSAPASAYGGLYISSHVYLPPGGRYYGDGSALSGIVSFDSLGTHVATTTLQMGGNPIVNAGAVTAAGALTSYSSATVASALGLGAPRLQLAPGVALSSAAAAPYGGVYFSSHVYLPPGVRIYGDGTGLTGLTGIADNLGSHLATTTLRMDGYPISGVGELTVAGSITTQSSVTVTGAPGLGAGRLQLRPGVALSSAAASVYGGIYISSHVFLPAGARYYGDGTALSLNAGTLASGTLPDARLSSNVLMKDSTQTLTGAAAFSSSAAFTLQHAALPGVYVSSGLVVGAGSLGVGTAAPLEKLDVAGAIRIGNTGASNAGAIKYAGGTFQGYNGASWLTLNGSYSVDSSTALWGLNSAVTPNTVYMVGLSSSLAIGGMDAGASKLRVTGSGATSASSALLAENSGSAQIFLVRDDGRIAAGQHAPQARLDVETLAGDDYVQIWRDQAGTVVSSLSASGVLYAGAAGLRGLPAGGGNIVDNLAATLGAGSSAGNGYINNLSSAAVGRAVSEAALDAQAVSGDTYVQIWRDSFGVIQASMTAAGLIYADGSRLRGLAGGGNVVDDLAATLGAGSSAGGGYINNLSSAAVGREVSEAALDAQAVSGDTYVQIWRDSFGVIRASMTAAGLIYADGSGLRGLAGGAADDLGDHTATQHLDLDGFMLLNASTVTVAAGQPWIAFSTTVLLAGNLYATGGAVLNDGPLGIGIQQPLASLHVSSEAGYSGNMVLVSTGVSPVFRVTGGGEVYSTRYHGDGSSLTGILTSPAQANLDMNGREIVNLNSVTISSRIVAGNQASEPLQQAVLMVLDLVEEKDIGTGDEMNEGSPNSGISAALMVKPVNAHNALELAMAGDFAVAMQDEATGTFPVLAGLRSTVMQRAPGTFVSAGYGLLTRTMVLDGTLDNVFGVYISSPTGPGTVTNNTGLHIADQSGSGVPFGHNIVSAGADSVNYFEGLIQSSAAVVSSRLAIPVMNEADFGTTTPQGAGEVYLCNGCTDTFLVISTAATRGGFAGFSKAASIN